MNKEEINYYLRVRNNELCMDEILHIIDPRNNPQIDHIIYENGMWQMWDKDGNYYNFSRRKW